MKKIIHTVMIVITMLLSVSLMGCASVKLSPNASKVITSPDRPPKGCKFIGQVEGTQGNFFTGGFTSNRNLEQGAQNDLRNKAAKLGGNFVRLITNRASNTGSGGGGLYGQQFQQTGVTTIGNVYRCPPHLIGE